MQRVSVPILLLAAVIYAQWGKTGWTENSAYFDLSTNDTTVYARTWDPLNGGCTYHTTDSGDTWTRISSADSSIDILSLVSVDDQVFAGTWDGIYRYSSRADWRSILQTGLPSETTIWSIARISGTLFAGSEGVVYVSPDSGTTWSEEQSGLPDNVRITSFFGNEDTILAGTDASGIYRSVNGGSRWTAAATGLDNKHIHQLTGMGATVFAVTLKGVFVSDNNGESWNMADEDLGSANCILAVHHHLFAGTDSSGVLYSDDSGATWTPANDELPENSRVWSLAHCNDLIFAGTDSGIWRIPYTTIKVTNGITKRQRQLDLQIRQRNRSKIAVQFHLSHPANVRMELYDLSGTRQVTVNSGTCPSGHHTIPVTTRSVAPGSYILQLTTGTTVHRRTFVLR